MNARGRRLLPPPVAHRLRWFDRLLAVAAAAGAAAVALGLVAGAGWPRSVLAGTVVAGVPAWPLLVWRARLSVAGKWPHAQRHLSIVTVGAWRAQRVRATLYESDLWACVSVYGVEMRCTHDGTADLYLEPDGHRALVVLPNQRLRWLRRLHEEPASRYFETSPRSA